MKGERSQKVREKKTVNLLKVNSLMHHQEGNNKLFQVSGTFLVALVTVNHNQSKSKQVGSSG